MPQVAAQTRIEYIYDGTLEGMLTAVFEAFARREDPANIVTEHNLQQNLLTSYVPIHTDLSKAERVQAGIINRLGQKPYDDIKWVFLSDDMCKGGVVLRYLQHLFAQGGKARTHLANQAVHDFEAILQVVSKERHYMLQFVRFAQLSNGVYFSRIEPKAAVVPLIMGHFAERFNIQPFMIYDANHDMAGVFDTQRWWLVSNEEVQIPSTTQQEDGFQALWQTFYDTIAIEGRYNPTCRRNFMPKRFWGNMCEMVPKQLRNRVPTTRTPTKAARQPVTVHRSASKALPARHPGLDPGSSRVLAG